jgi:pSer/pThr/pTyr-binding forkhead associated (FHA) protein
VVVITNAEAPHGNPRCDGQFVEGPRPAWARLVGEVEHDLTVNGAVIGRGSEVDVAISGEHVSRRHASLWRRDGRIIVTDLGSSNGTLVDGVRIDRNTEISIPSRLTFGDTTFLLHWAE